MSKPYFESLVAHVSDRCTLDCPGCYWQHQNKGVIGVPSVSVFGSEDWLKIAHISKALGAKEITWAFNDGMIGSDFTRYLSTIMKSIELGLECPITLSPTLFMKHANDFFFGNYSDVRLLKDVYISIDEFKLRQVQGGLSALLENIGIASSFHQQLRFHANFMPVFSDMLHLRKELAVTTRKAMERSDLFSDFHLVYFKRQGAADVSKEALLQHMLLQAEDKPGLYDVDHCISFPANGQPCSWGHEVIALDTFGSIRGCSYTEELAKVATPEDFRDWVVKNYPLPNRMGCDLIPLSILRKEKNEES